MEGDVTLTGLGLSPSDLQLLADNVSIVFNLAATVRFDESIKDAVQMNVNGPRQMLKICRNMKQLKVRLVYISCKESRKTIFQLMQCFFRHLFMCQLISLIFIEE